jgi:hypothetical protein
MEKFEKILSFFIKNPYSNIELSETDTKNFSKYILFSLAVVPLMILCIIGIGFSLIMADKSFLLLYYFYLLALFSILLIISISILKYFIIKYKLLARIFFVTSIALIGFTSILIFPLPLLFLIDNIQPITVYSYYLSFILIVLYYYYYYYYHKWKNLIQKKYYEKIKKKLKINKFYVDPAEKLFQFDLIEEEKNKPKLTKIAGIIVSLMMRFGFTIPVLAVLASSGTGDNGMIYFAIYLMFFIIPEMMKIPAKPFAIYKILKQIEKEENVTIYNGKLKTLDSEKKYNESLTKN